MEERRAVAELLMEYVRKNEVKKIEDLLRGNSTSWRDIIRFEFKVLDIMENILKYEILLPHLLSYEITTMSSFHLAAMSGHNDILVNFVDHDVPIDVGLSSGTTPLQLASLAGRTSTVSMLLDVYRAEVNRKDNYGWTAVHYAATEGHLNVINILVDAGADVNSRDKDGTSAAFRAQANGHQDVVTFLMDYGDMEMLNVEDDDDDDVEKRQSYHPIYATVTKYRKPKKPAILGPKPKYPPELLRPKKAGLSQVVPAPSLTEAQKAATLAHPKEIRNSSVRRLIRRELEKVFNPEPDYMCPVDVMASATGSGDHQDVLKEEQVGINTLTGIMREEFEKYRKEYLSPGPATAAHGFDSLKQEPDYKEQDNELYEDLYASIRDLGPAPPKPLERSKSLAYDDDRDLRRVTTNFEFTFAPALPPRNDSTLKPAGKGNRTSAPDLTSLRLERPPPPPAALKESLQNIAPKLGENWKKLAHALPLESTPEKVEQRINVIEKSYPGDRPKQAAMALGEWRINQGKNADVDTLVCALRKCNLGDIIEDVEMITSEFTA